MNFFLATSFRLAFPWFLKLTKMPLKISKWAASDTKRWLRSTETAPATKIGATSRKRPMGWIRHGSGDPWAPAPPSAGGGSSPARTVDCPLGSCGITAISPFDSFDFTYSGVTSQRDSGQISFWHKIFIPHTPSLSSSVTVIILQYFFYDPCMECILQWFKAES